MTLVMLMKTKVRHESVEELSELRTQFNEIYQEYGIEVIGHWSRVDKPTTTYTMTRYVDEADYSEKIRKLKSDERYITLTAKLAPIRKDFKMKRLIPA